MVYFGIEYISDRPFLKLIREDGEICFITDYKYIGKYEESRIYKKIFSKNVNNKLSHVEILRI
jgi:hypothetical protein